MGGIGDLNLIHFLDFYFTFYFFAGVVRRIGQYQSVARLVFTVPGRWPRLFQLVKQHRAVFLTWSTVLPALLALLLSVTQLVASRGLWPDAGKPPDGLTLARLFEHWPALIIVVPLGIAMFAVDLYGLIVVGTLDRAELEKYLDQAEYWLVSKTAHVVRVVTFGYVNPRRMVNEEVRKALVAASRLLNASLWWTSLMVALRVAFATSLWVTWAVTRP
jgi:hypothetical protein